MNCSNFVTAAAATALFFCAASASAACPDSPKVTAAQPKDKARLLKACQDDGGKMHGLNVKRASRRRRIGRRLWWL